MNKSRVRVFSISLLLLLLALFILYRFEMFGWAVFLIPLASFLYGLFSKKFGLLSPYLWPLITALVVPGVLWLDFWPMALIFGFAVFVIAWASTFAGLRLSNDSGGLWSTLRKDAVLFGILIIAACIFFWILKSMLETSFVPGM